MHTYILQILSSAVAGNQDLDPDSSEVADSRGVVDRNGLTPAALSEHVEQRPHHSQPAETQSALDTNAPLLCIFSALLRKFSTSLICASAVPGEPLIYRGNMVCGMSVQSQPDDLCSSPSNSALGDQLTPKQVLQCLPKVNITM